MKISEIIQELNEFKDKHGDLDVYTTHHENGFCAKAAYVELIKKDSSDGVDTDGAYIGY